MNAARCLLTIVLLATASTAEAQSRDPGASPNRWFIGSSLFMLANLAPEDSPSFFQLNVGTWLTPKDTIAVELITWRYTQPLGIPYGQSTVAERDAYPGAVRGAGAGLAYQRYWWKGLYSAVHAAAMRQDYQDQRGAPIQQGFQLFTTLRLGYHVEFLDGRVFLEPSVAATAWPVNTNRPPAFRSQDEKWHSYFLGEPGLHFGFRF